MKTVPRFQEIPEIPLNPLLQRERRISSLYQREAGRDFWDG
jgi:hypothetical protein